MRPQKMWHRTSLFISEEGFRKTIATEKERIPVSFKNYFIVYALQLSHFPPFVPLHRAPPPLRQAQHCCPRPWVMDICSLANTSTFQPVPTLPLSPYGCQSVPRFYASDSIFAHQFILLTRFHIRVRPHAICLSLTGLFR